MPSTSELISQLYAGYFNRAPDPDGLAYWTGRANAGMSLTNIAQSFAVQPEATTLYSFLTTPNPTARDAFISSVYSNLFNRAPDAAGLAYWSAQLSNPAISVSRFINDVLSGAQGNDALIATNKGAVGAFFVTQLTAANTPFTLAMAKNVLVGVNETSASVVAAVTVVNAAVAPPPPEVALTLVGTAGADTLIGSSLDDSITGGAGADNITGGGGNDTITMLVTAGDIDTINAGPGVDTLVLTGAAAGAIVVDLSSATQQFTDGVDALTQAGFENVNATAVTGFKVDVTTIAATTSVGLGGVTGATISGAATTIAINATALVDGGGVTLSGAAMNATVTGLQGDLTVDNAVAGGVAVTLVAVATTTVAFGTNTGGTHSVNGDALTDAQVLTLTGSDIATVSLVAGDLTAGAYAGALTVTATTGTNVITTGGAADTITAGDGDDTITGGAGADTITAGAGQDTISLTEGAAAADTVIYSTAFAAGNANAATITGFANGAGVDIFDIGFALAHGTLTFAAGTGGTNTVAASAPVTVTDNGTTTANTGVIFLLSGAGDQMAVSTAANAVANAVTAMTSTADFAAANVATGESLVVVLDDGVNSFVFHYVADATAATTAAADLELIGIINGVTDAGTFVTGDFI